ncbi:MAG TPA: penicillin-binding protein 2 [Chthonomonadales bacterium]|nr:penicillin-binding protein 2 [Chthonomonadales bacterium]
MRSSRIRSVRRAPGAEAADERCLPRRLRFVQAGLVLTLLALVGWTAYLQIAYGEQYRQHVRDFRFVTRTVPAKRGAILDRHGAVIARTRTLHSLYANPLQVPDPVAAAELLSPVTGRPAAELIPLLTPRRSSRGVVFQDVLLARDLSADGLAQFSRLRGRRETRDAIAGVNRREHPKRVSELGRDGVHVVGFLGRGDGRERGVLGIEQRLDSLLAGKDGSTTTEVDENGKPIPGKAARVEPVQHGTDVQITIDPTAQRIAERALEAGVARTRPAGATVIVLDPHTADVLAMASYPNTHPTKRVELRTDAADVLANRALAVYEPGSTLKILTVAAALAYGVITPESRFTCRGSERIGSANVSCVLRGRARAHGHGTLTLREVMSLSCNVITARIGVQLGMDRLESFLRAMGLEERTGLPLPGEGRGRFSFGPVERRESITKVSRMAFGHAISVTPIALTAAFGTIAQGGEHRRPRLVLSHRARDGSVIWQAPVAPAQRVMSPEIAQLLTEHLAAVVTEGTGKAAAIPGYTAAGKTGTAQKPGPHGGYLADAYVASFIGFVPARNPRAVIAVVFDEPTRGHYGSEVAAPVFRDVGRNLMFAWHVEPDDPSSLRKHARQR